MKGDLKKQYIFNSNFGLCFNCQKKHKIQSKNVIMCCEFDAKNFSVTLKPSFDISKMAIFGTP